MVGKWIKNISCKKLSTYKNMLKPQNRQEVTVWKIYKISNFIQLP